MIGFDENNRNCITFGSEEFHDVGFTVRGEIHNHTLNTGFQAMFRKIGGEDTFRKLGNQGVFFLL